MRNYRYPILSDESKKIIKKLDLDHNKFWDLLKLIDRSIKEKQNESNS